MNWEAFYLICFVVGLSLCALSFVGGFGHLHLGHLHLGHAHLGGHAHVGGHAASGDGSMSPVNGFTLMAFLCWFGGAGYLLQHYGGFIVPVVLALAILSGLAGALVIFWFLARVLLSHERVLTAEETEIVGVVGRVSGTIRAGGIGEILFPQNGARRFSPARSESGEAIQRDVEVMVMRYEDGIAYVRRWDEVNNELETLEPASPKPQSVL
jgi:hypothetical protein